MQVDLGTSFDPPPQSSEILHLTISLGSGVGGCPHAVLNSSHFCLVVVKDLPSGPVQVIWEDLEGVLLVGLEAGVVVGIEVGIKVCLGVGVGTMVLEIGLLAFTRFSTSNTPTKVSSKTEIVFLLILSTMSWDF